MKKILIATLACCAMATAASAQHHRKTGTARHTAARQHADADNDRVTDPGVMDPHAFYRTPYRSRNSGSYGRDVQMISLGFGFPNTLYKGYDYYYAASSTRRNGFGPLMAKYEHAIRDEIGIGGIGEFAYRRWRYDVGFDRYTDKAVGVGLSVLGYYHFNKFIPVRKLDLYAGLGISFSHTAYKDDFTGNTDSYVDVWPAAVAGGRYLFTPSFGGYLELGRTGFSWMNLGVTFRL